MVKLATTTTTPLPPNSILPTASYKYFDISSFIQFLKVEIDFEHLFD